MNEKTKVSIDTSADNDAAAQPKIDPTQTHQVAEFEHDRPLTTCRIDPTGQFVFAGAEDLNVYRWDLQSGDKATLVGHESWVRSMDFSPDGKWCYTAGWDGQLRWWESGSEQPAVTRTIQAHHGVARWVHSSPCGKMLVTCGNDKFVRVWDASNGEKLAEMSGHERHPYAVVFHPIDGRLVSQDLMGKIHIWDLQATARVATVDASVMTGYDNKFAADMGGARDMRFNPVGSTLASAGITNVVNSFAGVQDPIVVLVDWASGAITHHLRPPESTTGIAWGVRFHPQGFLVGAIARQNGRGMILFWSLDSNSGQSSDDAGASEATAKEPTDAVKPVDVRPFHTVALKKCARGLDVSPDGRRLVTAQSDGYVRVYEMTANPAKSATDSTG